MEIKENMEQNRDIQRLYYRYKRNDDAAIREFLKDIKIVRKKSNGVGSIFGYYPLHSSYIEKMMEKPRNVSLTFDGEKTEDEPILNLKEYKTIIYLVKSSSRFFLKPDIGEVLDQISFNDKWSGKINAICINEDYELLEETEGEHFLMTATLLTKI